MGLSILAKVFSFSRGPFKDEHVRQFYLGLKAYFSRNDDRNDIHTFIRACRKLFCNSNVAHNLLLQKILLENIHKFCVKPKPEETITPDTRKIYNKIIQSVICRQQEIYNAKKSLNDDMFYYKEFKNLVYESFVKEKEFFKSLPTTKPSSTQKPAQKQDSADNQHIVFLATWNFLITSFLDSKVCEFLNSFVNGFEQNPILVRDHIIIFGLMPFILLLDGKRF